MNSHNRKLTDSSGDEKKKAKLFLESTELLKDIIAPHTRSSYKQPHESGHESSNFDEVLFQSKKNTPSVFSEKTLSQEPIRKDVEQHRTLTNAVIRFIRAHTQIFAILISVSLGLLIGGLMRLRKEKYSALEVFIIKSPGLFYVRTISGMMMSLIAVSTVSSLARLNFKLGFELLWRFSLHAVIAKMIVITLAMVITLVLVPGNGVKVTKASVGEIETSDIFVLLTDIFRNAIPDKLFPLFFEKDRTAVVYTGPSLPDDAKLQQTLLNNADNWTYSLRTANFPNYIGLLVCSWGIGFALQLLNRTNRLILHLTISIENILLLLGDWFVRFATIGKFSLLIAAIVSHDGSGESQYLLPYVGTIVLTCFIHVFIIAPLYFYVMTFVNPWPYFKNMLPVLFTALTTSSSVVTLPSTLSYLEDDANLGDVPCRLMAPFGAVINMDGTAIYLTVTVIFVAQVLNRELTLWNLLIIWLYSFVQSINISPVPNDARITGVTTAFFNLGISLDEYQGLVKKLQNVDEIIDRFRTVVNVYGDIVTALIVNFVMMRLVEKRVGFMSIRAFLEKQDQKRRLSRARMASMNIARNNEVIEEQNVVKESMKKSDDLELVSISSTTSEYDIQVIENS